MADDDRRVEPRTVLVGRGSGTTPERIDEIRRRAREVEKLGRNKPFRRFSTVIDGLAGNRQKGKEGKEEPSEKEEKLGTQPKTGPRPGLLHPAQRDIYGREQGAKEPVIIKG